MTNWGNTPQYERNKEIYRLNKEKGLTLKQIGELYGLTSSRVGVIIKKTEKVMERERVKLEWRNRGKGE